ncbi:hypothetical protein [Microbacterium sp. NPDC087868]|uniref:hypothetical protein n=1 Tax=Microbacterium sp. NPDC087868 TaxID=3364195 RepID=UPI00384F4A9F
MAAQDEQLWEMIVQAEGWGAEIVAQLQHGPVPSHSSVFEPTSTSMWNITRVVEGKPVSLYHPDDVELRGGFAPVMVDGAHQCGTSRAL